MTSPLFGVIFDVDGVLVDSYEAHFQTWRSCARLHGRDCTEAEFAKAFGRTSREVMRETWDANLTDQEIAVFEDQKEAMYREFIAKNFPEMPGATSLVKTLAAAGIPMAIGSSGPPLNVQAVVKHLNASDTIRTVITGADVKVGKPNPEVFLLGAKGMGMAPERCIVLEDAPPGIEAALAAGMKCLGVVSRGRTQPELHKAHAHVTDLTEVTYELLAGLFE
ncbi:MAG: HAD family phosphatase [Fuerstiella sp.]